MKVPIYKAHGDDTDREFKGFYFAMPETTYCFSEDYKNHPVKIKHFIVFDEMTDWGLPNQPRIATIDPSTLEQIGWVETNVDIYNPSEWIRDKIDEINYDCGKCRHDGFICNECVNGSKYIKGIKND